MLPIGIIVLIFVELVTLTHHHHQICKLCWEMQWSEWSTRSSCPHNTFTDAFSTERFTMKLLLMLVLATIHLDAPPPKKNQVSLTQLGSLWRMLAVHLKICGVAWLMGNSRFLWCDFELHLREYLRKKPTSVWEWSTKLLSWLYTSLSRIRNRQAAAVEVTEEVEWSPPSTEENWRGGAE